MIIGYIPHGIENRITSRELTALTGMTGSEIRREINRLRQQGHPIGSDSRGYFIATSAQEIVPTIRNLNSRMAAINRAITGLKDAQYNMIEWNE